jgi:hypothetical protein
MSYCRLSSDDYQCDVYVYDADNGIATFVAARKHVFAEPLPEPVPIEDVDAWLERYVAVQKIVDGAELVPIGLPYDGEFRDGQTPDEAAAWLEELRDTGYRVPQYAIDGLREEAEP